MPNPSETAIGIRNCACVLSSRISGTRPKNVVSEVRMTARKRATPAVRTASTNATPSRRRRLTQSTSTRESFTTTPHSASMPM